jgi:hypothetical protein
MADSLSDDIAQSIPQPSSEDLVIWRYMDFTKFVALLETQSLFFVRIAHLDDPFEGSFPVSQSPLDRFLGMLPHGVFPEGTTVTVSTSPGLEDHWKVMRNWAMVTCWHGVAHESAAMWKLYAPTGGGVAIRSTVGRLRKALGAPSPPPSGFYGGDQYHIGMIDYIDFSSANIPLKNTAAQFFRKRRSFEHERELRALFMRWPINENRWFDHSRRPDDHGMSISVDLKVLIDEIRVAPQASHWYSELVAKMVSRYGIGVVPQQSEIDAKPLY